MPCEMLTTPFFFIRNGGFDSSPLVGRFCGTTIYSPIISHSNRMWLRFISDGSWSAQGFRLIYDGTATGRGEALYSAGVVLPFRDFQTDVCLPAVGYASLLRSNFFFFFLCITYCRDFCLYEFDLPGSFSISFSPVLLRHKLMPATNSRSDFCL